MNQKKVVAGISSVVLAMSLAACGAPTQPSKEMEKECKKWDKEKDGSYKCKDTSSHHYGSYLFMNQLYKSRNEMRNSSAYKSGTSKSYKLNRSTPSKSSSGKSTFFGKSGFSSGGAMHGSGAS